MDYTVDEQNEINRAKLQIKEAKRTMKNVNEMREARIIRGQNQRAQARKNMELGVAQMILDIKRTSALGYQAVLDNYESKGLWTGAMTITLTFKPLV